MDVVELLGRIRAKNIEALVEAIARAGPSHVEPAVRRSDGALAVEGEWGLPIRLDYLPRGRESERGDPVRPVTALSFSRFSVTIDNVEVDVGPLAGTGARFRPTSLTAV